MSKYAISDIHGCIATFKTLLDKIKFSKEDELYLLGDYIDRGPDSKGVIDHIWYLQKSGYQVHCLRGNHENMLLQEVINPIHYYNGRIIVHGHTPQRFTFLKRGHSQMKEVGAINIDGGCVFSSHGLGQLCALELDSQELIIQKNVE